MICFHINVSTPWTHFYYVSNIIDFMDTFFESVHAGDMKKPDTALFLALKKNRLHECKVAKSDYQTAGKYWNKLKERLRINSIAKGNGFRKENG